MAKQANRSRFLGHSFDSDFELAVYKELLKIYACDEIEVHDSLQDNSKTRLKIKEKTQHFDAQFWNCDFYVIPHDIWIEVKGSVEGQIFDRFMITLRQLDTVSPDVIDRLIVVTGDNQNKERKTNKRRICKGLYTTPFSELRTILNSLKCCNLVKT